MLETSGCFDKAQSLLAAAVSMRLPRLTQELLTLAGVELMLDSKHPIAPVPRRWTKAGS